MFETIIPIDVIPNIFLFLDKKSLISYDIAMFSKLERSIFLESLRKHYLNKHLCVCKWSFSRCIKSKHESVDIKDIKYISDVCKKLTICGRIYDRYDRYYRYSIINHNIEYLYIDCMGTTVCFGSLEARNLKKITIIRPKESYCNIFTNITEKCPNLNTIICIMCDDKFNEYLHQVIRNDKIKIICKIFR